MSDAYDDIRLEDGESLESCLTEKFSTNARGGGATDGVYPNAQVRMVRAQFSLEHLKKLVEVRKELVIEPIYQRESVWGQKQKNELVESILMGIPLPLIYLFEGRDGRKQVVDGRQRICAIIDFMNNKFALKDLRILQMYNGYKFSELPLKTQGVFEDYQLLYYIIQPPTPERIKYDIFDRVNRGGTRLNNQEMRNALYHGHATELINKIANSEEFKMVTEGSVSPKRMRDRYAALRVLAFYLYFTNQLRKLAPLYEVEYRSDIDDFLAKTMIAINDDSSREQRDSWLGSIKSAFREIYETIGGSAFRFSSKTGIKRPINMPLMESLTFLFLLQWDRSDKERVRLVVDELKGNEKILYNFTHSVDSTARVRARFQVMIDLASKLDNI